MSCLLYAKSNASSFPVSDPISPLRHISGGKKCIKKDKQQQQKVFRLIILKPLTKKNFKKIGSRKKNVFVMWTEEEGC